MSSLTAIRPVPRRCTVLVCVNTASVYYCATQHMTVSVACCVILTITRSRQPPLTGEHIYLPGDTSFLFYCVKLDWSDQLLYEMQTQKESKNKTSAIRPKSGLFTKLLLHSKFCPECAKFVITVKINTLYDKKYNFTENFSLGHVEAVFTVINMFSVLLHFINRSIL